MGFAEGVKKYGRGNWRKGFPEHELCDSLLGHLAAHLSGEMIDPDSATGATHLDKVLCNALMLNQQARQHVPRVAPTHDTEGFNLKTGFNREGVHRMHDDKDPLCNCPMCR